LRWWRFGSGLLGADFNGIDSDFEGGYLVDQRLLRSSLLSILQRLEVLHVCQREPAFHVWVLLACWVVDQVELIEDIILDRIRVQQRLVDCLGLTRKAALHLRNRVAYVR
jgi:hypothetical protein